MDQVAAHCTIGSVHRGVQKTHIVSKNHDGARENNTVSVFCLALFKITLSRLSCLIMFDIDNYQPQSSISR